MSLNRYRLRHRAKTETGRSLDRGAARTAGPVDRPHPAVEHGGERGHTHAGGTHHLANGRRLSGGRRRDRAHLRAAHLLRGRTENLRRPPSRETCDTRGVRYTLLLAVLYPVVWATNLLANGVLRALEPRANRLHVLSSEELRTVLAEAGAMIPQRHRQMLMSILDLENATVEDIMVPRVEIVGIDMEDSWDKILEQLRQSQHTRLPVFEGDIDRIIGVLHMKRVVHELAAAGWTRQPGRGGQRARSVLRSLGHAAQHAAVELPARQAPARLRGGRVRDIQGW